jgi:hypothetical protein
VGTAVRKRLEEACVRRGRSAARAGLGLCVMAALTVGVACTYRSETKERGPATPAGPERVEPEEYAVYSTLIKSMFITDGVELLVIEQQTSLGPIPLAELGQEMELVRRKVPEVEAEVADDFVEKNGTPARLEHSIDIPASYVLVDAREVRGMDWGKFYQKYPKSQGIMSLSRVGFNHDRDRALVYVGNQSGGKTGMGFYVFMVKQDGGWQVTGRTAAWVS